MKSIFFNRITLLLMAAMFIVACGDDENEDPTPEPDTIQPTIETIIPAKTGQEYALGGTFAYKGTFTDNEELKQVVFSLSDKKPAPAASLKAATGVDDDPWVTEDVTVPLTGKTQTLEQGLFGGIPGTKIWTGTYTLTITCTDKAGNKAISSVDVLIQ